VEKSLPLLAGTTSFFLEHPLSNISVRQVWGRKHIFTCFEELPLHTRHSDSNHHLMFHMIISAPHVSCTFFHTSVLRVFAHLYKRVANVVFTGVFWKRDLRFNLQIFCLFWVQFLWSSCTNRLPAGVVLVNACVCSRCSHLYYLLCGLSSCEYYFVVYSRMENYKILAQVGEGTYG
jgi:hypothetical protein